MKNTSLRAIQNVHVQRASGHEPIRSSTMFHIAYVSETSTPKTGKRSSKTISVDKIRLQVSQVNLSNLV